MSLDLDNFNVEAMAFQRSLADAASHESWKNVFRKAKNLGGATLSIDKLLGNMGTYKTTKNVNAIVNSSIILEQNLTVGEKFNQILIDSTIVNQSITQIIKNIVEEKRPITETEAIELFKEVSKLNDITKDSVREAIKNKKTSSFAQKQQLLFLSNRIYVIYYLSKKKEIRLKGYQGYTFKLLQDIQNFCKVLFDYQKKHEKVKEKIIGEFEEKEKKLEEKENKLFENILEEDIKEEQEYEIREKIEELIKQQKIFKETKEGEINIEYLSEISGSKFKKELRIDKLPSLKEGSQNVIEKTKILNVLTDPQLAFKKIFRLKEVSSKTEPDQFEIYGNQKGCMILLDADFIRGFAIPEEYKFSEIREFIEKSPIFPSLKKEIRFKPVYNPLFGKSIGQIIQNIPSSKIHFEEKIEEPKYDIFRFPQKEEFLFNIEKQQENRLQELRFDLKEQYEKQQRRLEEITKQYIQEDEPQFIDYNEPIFNIRRSEETGGPIYEFNRKYPEYIYLQSDIKKIAKEASQIINVNEILNMSSVPVMPIKVSDKIKLFGVQSLPLKMKMPTKLVPTKGTIFKKKEEKENK
jgi:hypothetical protein